MSLFRYPNESVEDYAKRKAEAEYGMEMVARTLYISDLKDGDRLIWRHYKAGANEVDRPTFESLVRTLPTVYNRFDINGRLAVYDDVLDYLAENPE